MKAASCAQTVLYFYLIGLAAVTLAAVAAAPRLAGRAAAGS
jgi:hypothetical protein